MVRVDWGFNGRVNFCSYKRITLFICSLNILIALHVLHSLYGSLYIYSPKDSQTGVKYTEDQVRRMEKSIKIRKLAEPRKLIKLVKGIKSDFRREEMAVEVPSYLKQKLTNEILQKLKSLDSNASSNMQRGIVESWRKEKLEKTKAQNLRNIQSSTSQLEEEAGIKLLSVHNLTSPLMVSSVENHINPCILVRALESNWPLLMEDIGLWIPDEVINKEYNDEPDNQEEFETPLPGRPLPLECNPEPHTDYSGNALRWGLTNPKESAADCCEACLDHAKNAKPGDKKCNIWVYCPSETGCFSPDRYQHKHQECWLKYSENPTITFKDKYSELYRNVHPNAPLAVPWASGVISA